MAPLKLVLAFFALVILGAGAVVVAKYWENYFRPNWEAEKQYRSSSPTAGQRELPDLGRREFVAAEQLLVDGELLAARDRLYYLMDYYPNSKTLPEARRIIGEINLDLLLSRTPIPGKEEHVVKRGDLLAPIRRKYQTSYDYIMRASGRTNHTIFPGDRLVVYPLNFKVRISLGDESITILDPKSDRFFKEYPIREIKLPNTVKAPATTRIAALVAWHGSGQVNFESPHYFESKKWIRMEQPGLFIRSHNPPIPPGEAGVATEAPPIGVMVDQADLEEMFAFLRSSNPVLLVP